MIVSAMQLEGLSRDRGARPRVALRHPRPHRAVAQGPLPRPAALRAPPPALARLRGDPPLHQGDRDHRREHAGQGVQPRGHRDDDPAERETDRLRPLEPHRPRRVHGRGGVRLVQRQGHLRRRDPVSAGRLRRQDVHPQPGEQLPRLPRRRARGLRDPGEAHHRRDVHRGRACHRRPGDRRPARARDALPAAEQRARDGGADRRARGEAHLRPQPRAGRTAQGHPRVARAACSTGPSTGRCSHGSPRRRAPDRNGRDGHARRERLDGRDEGARRALLGRADAPVAHPLLDRQRSDAEGRLPRLRLREEGGRPGEPGGGSTAGGKAEAICADRPTRSSPESSTASSRSTCGRRDRERSRT